MMKNEKGIPMKKTLVACAASLLFVAGAANAFSINGEVGENYTNLGFGGNNGEPGLVFGGNWAHSDDDGDIAGLGLGYNLPIGPFITTLGGKALYLSPKDGDDGYAVALGGGLRLPMGKHFALFGDYYYAPDSLSSGVSNYTEANAGITWTIIPLVSVTAGYRYIEMAGEDGHRDNVLADGAYLGAGLSF
jgi:hypothetical protein